MLKFKSVSEFIEFLEHNNLDIAIDFRIIGKDRTVDIPVIDYGSHSVPLRVKHR